MDYNEIVDWLAYDMSQDDEFKKKIEREEALKAQENFTAEQEAAALEQMFLGFKNVIR